MKRILSTLFFSLVGASFASSASATVLNFDDITGFVAMTDVDGGHYGGLDWTGGDWSASDGPELPFNASSGNGRLISGFGDDDSATAIRFDAPSTFQGAAFAGLEGAFVSFEMFFGGQQVATSATLDPSAAPVFLGSGYTGLVDEVIVVAAEFGQGNYAMDDFTFNAVAAVPEPESYALLLAGLGVIGFLARRRKPRG